MNALKLVGMSEGAKKRKARALFVKKVFADTGTVTTSADEGPRWFHLWCRGNKEVASMDPAYFDLRAKYRVGERLAPCPGCCACWGCEQDTDRTNPLSGNSLHWAGPLRKHTFECPMGPPLAGRSKRQIEQMNRWQYMLPDDCDGSGVIPAKRAKR